MLIQTDTRLNLGCSGGALLDLRGDLVGLTTSLAGIAGGETPGGFAVPLDRGMLRIIDKLRHGEEVEYGFLGVTLDLSGEREDEERFVHIREVLPGGPAIAGGLRSGYYIKTINDKEVHNNDELFLAIGMHLAGNTVRIGAAQTPAGPKGIYEVTLAKYAVAGPVIASKRPQAPRGLRVDWTSTLPLRWRNPFIPDGVVIREVRPNSSADKARLQEGMIIARVNNSPVKMPADFYREMENLKGRPVDLTLLTPEGREEHVTIDGK